MKRLDHDDLGGGAGFEFTESEFEEFLSAMEKTTNSKGLTTATRWAGYAFPIPRKPEFEWLFRFCNVQSDITVLAICKEGRLDALNDYIATMRRGMGLD